MFVHGVPQFSQGLHGFSADLFTVYSQAYSRVYTLVFLGGSHSFTFSYKHVKNTTVSYAMLISQHLYGIPCNAAFEQLRIEVRMRLHTTAVLMRLI